MSEKQNSIQGLSVYATDAPFFLFPRMKEGDQYVKNLQIISVKKMVSSLVSQYKASDVFKVILKSAEDALADFERWTKMYLCFTDPGTENEVGRWMTKAEASEQKYVQSPSENETVRTLLAKRLALVSATNSAVLNAVLSEKGISGDAHFNSGRDGYTLFHKGVSSRQKAFLMATLAGNFGFPPDFPVEIALNEVSWRTAMTICLQNRDLLPADFDEYVERCGSNDVGQFWGGWICRSLLDSLRENAPEQLSAILAGDFSHISVYENRDGAVSRYGDGYCDKMSSACNSAITYLTANLYGAWVYGLSDAAFFKFFKKKGKSGVAHTSACFDDVNGVVDELLDETNADAKSVQVSVSDAFGCVQNLLREMGAVNEG